jgi:hypothetical protein
LQRTYIENKKWENKAPLGGCYEENNRKNGGTKLFTVVIVKKTIKEKRGVLFPLVVVATNIY